MKWYSVGSVSVTAQSRVVTGALTQFATYVQPGYGFTIDGVTYEVDTVDSPTQLTLSKPYRGATTSAAEYLIFPTQGLNREVYDRTVQLLDTFGPLRNNMEELNEALETASDAAEQAGEAAVTLTALLDGAEQAATAAQDARVGSEAARDLAEDHRDAAEVARLAAEAAEHQSEIIGQDVDAAKVAAQNARAGSEAAEVSAKAARDTAAASAGAAAADATDAEASAIEAQATLTEMLQHNADAAASAIEAQAHEEGAESAANIAVTAAGAAEASAGRARASEENASASETVALAAQVAAGAAKDAAEAARDAASLSKTDTEAARAAAVNAMIAARTAQDAAELARDATLASTTDADLAKLAAQAAQSAAEASASAAGAAKSAAQAAKVEAEAARLAAEVAWAGAEDEQETATDRAIAAENAQAAAEAALAAALAAQHAAELARDQAAESVGFNIADYQLKSEKGQPNGYASLDINGKVPVAQLDTAVLGGLNYQGSWNAATNSPTIPPASGSNKGQYFKVGTAGATAVSGVTDWQVGDWLVSNGSIWDKIDNTDQVQDVNGQRGSVVITKSDVGLANVDNTSDTNKPISIATQSALDAKLAISSKATSGEATAGSDDTKYMTPAKTASAIGAATITQAQVSGLAAALAGKIADGDALKSDRQVEVTPSISGGVLTLDLSLASSFYVSWNANISAINVTNVPSGAVSWTLTLVGAGGSSVAWNTSTFKFPSGSAPTLMNTTSAENVLTMWTRNAGTRINVSFVGAFV